MMDANKYSYRVIWSEEDQEFVGLLRRIPGSFPGWPRPGRILQGIVDLVKDSIADMEQNGEKSRNLFRCAIIQADLW